VDTAGIDKKITKVSEVEKKIQNDTIRAVKQSHVVVCMIDALRAF
jgi:predicted GTPase